MRRGNRPRLTKRSVDALSVPSGDAVFWDRDLPGFGVRVHASGRKVYVVQTRGPDGAPKRVSIGRHGDTSAEQARKTAAGAIDRIRRGEEPFELEPEPEPTVADLAERYMESHVRVNCRPNTVKAFGRAVRLYIIPHMGHLPLSEVERSHVSSLHHELREKPYQANAVVDVLARMFRLAEAWGMTPPRRNPCRSVRRYRERRRERYLTPAEYGALGRVLDAAEADGSASPQAIAAIRLLVLTGCRKNEIVTLKWDDVDRTAGELRLRDGKTGGRRVPLTPAAWAVLDSVPRTGDNPWVIAGRSRGDHYKNLDAAWLRLRARAGLCDMRIHDLRHSYASRALALGASLSTIGALLGHRRAATTARYAHLMREAEKASAARVGGSIGADVLPPGGW